jgi:hypothetical protein
VATILNFLAIKKRIRTVHPEVWRKLGFPDVGFYVRATDERAEGRAQIEFIKLVFGDFSQRVSDPILARLILRYKILLVSGACMTVLYALLFFAFEIAPVATFVA